MSEEILGASKNVCVCIYGPMYICVYNPVLLYLMVSKYFKLVSQHLCESDIVLYGF